MGRPTTLDRSDVGIAHETKLAADTIFDRLHSLVQKGEPAHV
jgi:hypothetical protein